MVRQDQGEMEIRSADGGVNALPAETIRLTVPNSPIAPGARAGSARIRSWMWRGMLVGLPVVGLLWGVWPGGLLTPHPLASCSAGVLLAVLLVCGVTDLAWHKIYNWATYPAFLWAIVCNGTWSVHALLVAHQGKAPSPYWDRVGAVGLLDSLVGSTVCFGCLLVVYRASGSRGAGDVKLAGVLGAWLGLTRGLAAILCTYAIAGVVLACWVIVTTGPLYLGRHALRALGHAALPWVVAPASEPELAPLKRPVPMAAFFAAGTLLVLLGVLQ